MFCSLRRGLPGRGEVTRQRVDFLFWRLCAGPCVLTGRKGLVRSCFARRVSSPSRKFGTASEVFGWHAIQFRIGRGPQGPFGKYAFVTKTQLVEGVTMADWAFRPVLRHRKRRKQNIPMCPGRPTKTAQPS